MESVTRLQTAPGLSQHALSPIQPRTRGVLLHCQAIPSWIPYRSDICGSAISSMTASRGDRCAALASSDSPSRIRATAVSTGKDTRYFRAKLTTTPAVATPSATSPIDAKIALSFSPCPSRTPTVRFLDRETKHVSITSPTPEGPASVAVFAPILSASQRISLIP
eukprot:scaffold1200_cov383-Prasinococcus_capsulatus_cf.AAC.12